MHWNIEKTIPTLAVPQLDAAIGFYEKLGFAADWRWPDEMPTHAGMSQGNAEIMFALCDPDERADLCFVVDDVQACFDSIMKSKPWELAEAAGAISGRSDAPPRRALGPPPAPADQPYGMRDFCVIDPWGHAVTFSQPVHSE